MPSSALAGFLCSFELCLVLGTQRGTAPATGAALAVLGCPTAEHFCQCQCQSPLLPPCPLSISQGPSMQVLFPLQPYNTVRGFLLVEFMERNCHSPMSYVSPQVWMQNLASSAWVVKRFILLFSVSWVAQKGDGAYWRPFVVPITVQLQSLTKAGSGSHCPTVIISKTLKS